MNINEFINGTQINVSVEEFEAIQNVWNNSDFTNKADFFQWWKSANKERVLEAKKAKKTAFDLINLNEKYWRIIYKLENCKELTQKELSLTESFASGHVFEYIINIKSEIHSNSVRISRLHQLFR